MMGYNESRKARVASAVKRVSIQRISPIVLLSSPLFNHTRRVHLTAYIGRSHSPWHLKGKISWLFRRVNMNKRKYLTETEIKIINEAYKGANPERDRCLIWMCFIHGCRVSEIRHWRLSDLDLHNHSIYVKRLKMGFPQRILSFPARWRLSVNGCRCVKTIATATATGYFFRKRNAAIASADPRID